MCVSVCPYGIVTSQVTQGFRGYNDSAFLNILQYTSTFIFKVLIEMLEFSIQILSSGIDGMLNNLSQKITSFMQHKIKFYSMLSINLYSVVNLLHVQMILF